MASRWRSPHDGDIARLAVPALGTLVAEPLYVLADTAIVGNIGTTELAGLALASTILLTVHALMIFLAYGTTGPVARLIGAGRSQEAAHRSIQGLWLALVLGVVAAVFMAVFGSSLISLLGGSGQVQEAAELYLYVSLPGFPFLLVAMAANGSFHGRQDTRTPLVLALLGAVGNLVLEMVLVFGFGFGLGASALSTAVAQIVVAILAVAFVGRWARSLAVRWVPDPPVMRRMLRAGGPLVVRTASLRASFTLSTAVAARMGVAEVAAHQIALGVWSTMALALDAVAIAGQALTGRWLGVGDRIRAREATSRMIEIDIAVGVVLGGLLIVVREPLAGLFTNDPAVAALTTFVLLHVGLQQPLNGVVFALDGILIGAGDLVFLAVTMLAASVLFALLAVLLVATGAGLGWLWGALAVFMLARAVPLVLRWRQDSWLVVGTV